MKDMRELKNLIGDVFGENGSYQDVDILGEDTNDVEIQQDTRTASKSRSTGQPARSDRDIRNNIKKLASRHNVDLVKDFDDYTSAKPKKTDGAKSVLPESVVNFTPEDIKALERIRDLPTLKARALSLITNPSKKPIKPEKQAYFQNRLEGMRTPYQIIKLMYDLLLSGEGLGVQGSKYSTRKSHYRRTFDEGMADTNVSITGYGEVDPNYEHDTEFKIVLQTPGGKMYRYRDVDDLKSKMRAAFHKNPRLWDDIRAGKTLWTVFRDDTELQEDEVDLEEAPQRHASRSLASAAKKSQQRGEVAIRKAVRMMKRTGMSAEKAGREFDLLPGEVAKAQAMYDEKYGERAVTESTKEKHWYNSRRDWEAARQEVHAVDDDRNMSRGEDGELLALWSEARDSGWVKLAVTEDHLEVNTYELDEDCGWDPRQIAQFLVQFGEGDGIDIYNGDAAEIQEYLNDALHYDRINDEGEPIDLGTVEAAMELILTGRVDEVAPAIAALGKAVAGGAARAVGGAMARGAMGAAKGVAGAAAGAIGSAAGTAASAMSSSNQQTDEDAELDDDFDPDSGITFYDEDAYLHFMDRFEDEVDYLDNGELSVPSHLHGDVEQWMVDHGYEKDQAWDFLNELEEDLQNGYKRHHRARPDDYFPSGATSPTARKIGPGGRGDNRLGTKVPRNGRGVVQVEESRLVQRYAKMFESYMEEGEYLDDDLLDEAPRARLDPTSKVSRVISDNFSKTTKGGGPVSLSIFRGNTVVAYIQDESGKIIHSFNAKVGPNNKWRLGNSPMQGVAARTIGSKKSFDDATAAAALQALFDVAG